MIKALIVEDNKKSAELLKQYIANLFTDIEIVGLASTVNEAVDLVYKEKPSLIFLDINLQQEVGFDILKKTNSDDYVIIVTTAYSEYSLQAIKNSAIDYILKPYDVKELKEAVSKAKRQIELKRMQKESIGANPEKLNDRIFISTLEGLIFIKIEDIVCISADSSYSEIYLINGEKKVSSKSLATYEELLSSHFFVRVHKSYLVNIKHIKKYNRGRNGTLHMANSMIVKVGESRKEDLLKHLIS